MYDIFSTVRFFDNDKESYALSDPSSSYGQSREEFVEWLKQFTKQAAIEIINFLDATEQSPAINVIRYQLIRSATSTAANYRAACRARSRKEFFAKICIVVEECDETLFWLEVLHESNINIDQLKIEALQPQWRRILGIVAKAKSNSKSS